VVAKFLLHLEDGLFVRLALEPPDYVWARNWIARFDVPLRSLDALHLAVADSGNTPLVTADRALFRAAQRLGIEAVLLTP
jgi:predicted nucleic acid-binding protein